MKAWASDGEILAPLKAAGKRTIRKGIFSLHVLKYFNYVILLKKCVVMNEIF